MHTISFEALGTGWHIDIDAENIPVTLESEMKQLTDQFGQQQSRFINTSEATSFRDKKAGIYTVSPTLATLLNASQQLRHLTNGGFDPAVATLLEEVGYDAEYRLSQAPNRHEVKWRRPEWSIHGDQLSIDGPVVFDIGGIGKGYWIDQLSEYLIAQGFPYHLVDGGGDMKATTKKDGSGWNIAIEWPGKPDTAIGQVELKNQGFAASDTFRRRWKQWHHLIHAQQLQPVEHLAGAVATAPTAFLADQCTSALFFSTEKNYSYCAQQLHSEYLIIHPDDAVLMSRHWSGEFF